MCIEILWYSISARRAWGLGALLSHGGTSKKGCKNEKELDAKDGMNDIGV